MAYDTPVRQYLQNKGVASGDIAYDKNSGNVTVRGQNFYKPELNMAGTTYSNQQNLDNAYSAYSKSLPVIQPNGSIGTTANVSNVTQPVSQPPAEQPTKPANGGYSNPYTSMIAEVMKHLNDSYNAPQQDIYSSPQYAAAKANQDRQSAESIRRSNESAAGAGLGHSTIMTDRSQGIQNDNDNYLATQLVPQIQSQLAQERQAQITQEQNQFNNLLGLSDRADQQYNSDRTFNYNAGQDDITNKRNEVNDAATYGGVYNPSGLTYEQAKSKMAANSAAYASASPDEQHRLHEENKQLGELLGQKFDSKTGTYSKDQGYIGYKTLASQQIEQALATGEIDQKTAQAKLKESEDPNSITNQANKIDLQIKKLDLASYSEKQQLEIEQLRKNIAQIGVVHFKPQTEAEIAQDKVTLATANKQLEDIQNGKFPGDKPASVDYDKDISRIAGMYVTPGSNGDAPIINNPKAMKDAIIALGMDDDETDRYLILYGLQPN